MTRCLIRLEELLIHPWFHLRSIHTDSCRHKFHLPPPVAPLDDLALLRHRHVLVTVVAGDAYEYSFDRCCRAFKNLHKHLSVGPKDAGDTDLHVLPRRSNCEFGQFCAREPIGRHGGIDQSDQSGLTAFRF